MPPGHSPTAPAPGAPPPGRDAASSHRDAMLSWAVAQNAEEKQYASLKAQTPAPFFWNYPHWILKLQFPIKMKAEMVYTDRLSENKDKAALWLSYWNIYRPKKGKGSSFYSHNTMLGSESLI